MCVYVHATIVHVCLYSRRHAVPRAAGSTITHQSLISLTFELVCMCLGGPVPSHHSLHENCGEEQKAYDSRWILLWRRHAQTLGAFSDLHLDLYIWRERPYIYRERSYIRLERPTVKTIFSDAALSDCSSHHQIARWVRTRIEHIKTYCQAHPQLIRTLGALIYTRLIEKGKAMEIVRCHLPDCRLLLVLQLCI